MKSFDNIELLPVEEYAKRFCVSRTTVFEWKKCGILVPGRHYIQIGRTLRFVWCSEIICELHDRNFRNTGKKDGQPVKSALTRKMSNKKSAINMEY
ncbi:MAG: hypothetical protein PVH42_20100 [Desulfobacterales bacterium]|jgi:hypothetical protein